MVSVVIHKDIVGQDVYFLYREANEGGTRFIGMYLSKQSAATAYCNAGGRRDEWLSLSV